MRQLDIHSYKRWTSSSSEDHWLGYGSCDVKYVNLWCMMWSTVKLTFSWARCSTMKPWKPQQPPGTDAELDDLDRRWRGPMEETKVVIQETEFLLVHRRDPALYVNSRSLDQHPQKDTFRASKSRNKSRKSTAIQGCCESLLLNRISMSIVLKACRRRQFRKASTWDLSAKISHWDVRKSERSNSIGPKWDR